MMIEVASLRSDEPPPRRIVLYEVRNLFGEPSLLREGWDGKIKIETHDSADALRKRVRRIIAACKGHGYILEEAERP